MQRLLNLCEDQELELEETETWRRRKDGRNTPAQVDVNMSRMLSHTGYLQCAVWLCTYVVSWWRLRGRHALVYSTLRAGRGE
jgi:hypothetical protein